jgi:hypothetical protein
MGATLNSKSGLGIESAPKMNNLPRSQVLPPALLMEILPLVLKRKQSMSISFVE